MRIRNPFARHPKEVNMSDCQKTRLLLERLQIEYDRKIDLGTECTELWIAAKELNRIRAGHLFYIVFIFDSMGRFQKVGVYE